MRLLCNAPYVFLSAFVALYCTKHFFVPSASYGSRRNASHSLEVRKHAGGLAFCAACEYFRFVCRFFSSATFLKQQVPSGSFAAYYFAAAGCTEAFFGRTCTFKFHGEKLLFRSQKQNELMTLPSHCLFHFGGIGEFVCEALYFFLANVLVHGLASAEHEYYSHFMPFG